MLIHQPKTKQLSSHCFPKHTTMVGLEESNYKLINLGTKNSMLSITHSALLNYWLVSSIFKVQNMKIEKEVGIREWKGDLRAIYIFSKVEKSAFISQKMCFYFMKLCFFFSWKITVRDLLQLPTRVKVVVGVNMSDPPPPPPPELILTLGKFSV